MSEHPPNDAGIGASERTFDIIEYLSRETGATLTQIAEAVGVAKSTAHDHLATLQRRGYVTNSSEGYQLGMELLHLGESARQRTPANQIAREKVEKLAEETNERAQFIVEEGGRGIYVYRETGQDAVLTDSTIGGHVLLHATAAGKALLSHYDDDEVLEIVGEDLEEVNENTITDPEELLTELDRVRERGYAFNKSENTEGLRAIGTPVELSDGTLLGAISVSGPTHRMKGERFEQDLPDRLLGVVNELELNIAYSERT